MPGFEPKDSVFPSPELRALTTKPWRPALECHLIKTCSTGYPELSCVGCHALFHPKCVGLSEGVNYASCEFYCYACTPPAGKENNEPPFKKSSLTPVSQVPGKVKRYL